MTGGSTMDLNEAMERRHSVRMYSDEPVSQNLLNDIAVEVKRCNAASGLHFQMAAGLDDAFCGYKTHYGRFAGVHNAIALVAKIDVPYDLHPKKKASAAQENLTTNVTELASATTKGVRAKDSVPQSSRAQNSATQPSDPVPSQEAATEEKVGYYGEQLALTLVGLGLDCSWAVLDDASTGWWKLEPGERMVWIIAFGHAARPGAKHHSKPLDSFCSLPTSLGKNGEAPTLADAPAWFQRGIAAASLAPTSLSQQPFHFTLEDTWTNPATVPDPASRQPTRSAAEGCQISVTPDATHHTDISRTTLTAPNDFETTEGESLPTVSACVTPGLFAHVGLGCAKRNFEIGAGTSNFAWA
ncbi:nitroreductase family protein [Bifidobacterium sp. ESL0764]|uniref:nitroreductase family protein n=1 Tax=Bifidobacterium sp. ESL0764 TaxID=2983228 RepID=UPI0023F6E75F|nr:nitroreductase family protein [Bifidobacterium sp. ESL0764]WEV65769.1 hypothetical protein OZX71_08510 [Bifidobacterium sp. ESL0764]